MNTAHHTKVFSRNYFQHSNKVQSFIKEPTEVKTCCTLLYGRKTNDSCNDQPCNPPKRPKRVEKHRIPTRPTFSDHFTQKFIFPKQKEETLLFKQKPTTTKETFHVTDKQPQKKSKPPLITLIKTQRTHFATEVPQKESDAAIPIKPQRSYKARRVTPISRALEPIAEQHYQEAFQKIKHIIKTVKNEPEISRNCRNKTLLSSLNLFLALSYEGIRHPDGVMEICRNIATKKHPENVPTIREKQREEEKEDICKGKFSAISQLKSGRVEILNARNIPTLLLFNIVYGRSL